MVKRDPCCPGEALGEMGEHSQGMLSGRRDTQAELGGEGDEDFQVGCALLRERRRQKGSAWSQSGSGWRGVVSL